MSPKTQNGEKKQQATKKVISFSEVQDWLKESGWRDRKQLQLTNRSLSSRISSKSEYKVAYDSL